MTARSQQPTSDLDRVRSRRAITRLLIAAALCAVALAVLTVVFVWTHAGQRLDDAALRGQVVQNARSAQRSDELLRTISVGSLAFFGVSLVGIAAARGRWHLALGVGAVIAAIAHAYSAPSVAAAGRSRTGATRTSAAARDAATVL